MHRSLSARRWVAGELNALTTIIGLRWMVNRKYTGTGVIECKRGCDPSSGWTTSFPRRRQRSTPLLPRSSLDLVSTTRHPICVFHSVSSVYHVTNDFFWRSFLRWVLFLLLIYSYFLETVSDDAGWQLALTYTSYRNTWYSTERK